MVGVRCLRGCPSSLAPCQKRCFAIGARKIRDRLQFHLLCNPASEIDLPKLEQRLPKHVLTISDVETILARCDVADPSGLGIRDRAILETPYSTGNERPADRQKPPTDEPA